MNNIIIKKFGIRAKNWSKSIWGRRWIRELFEGNRPNKRSKKRFRRQVRRNPVEYPLPVIRG